MRSALRTLSIVCVFVAGCYATAAWPELRPRLARLLEPVTAHLEAAKLAEARQVEILALRADLARCQEQLDALECEVAAARLREQQLGSEVLATRQEHDQALLEARRAVDRYSQLCRAIRALDLTGDAVPTLARE